MGASATGVKAAEQQPAAESLLTAFKTLSAAERRRHASVLNYWLSVRGDKEFPPLHDLDPLELSDAGPSSILLELISGGHDAEIRHLGEALREEAWPERIVDAPNPSVLSCIARKLPIVAISRDFLAFEDDYETAAGKTRCSVTLLPLSAGGAWVDYVYALVSTETDRVAAAVEPEAPEAELEPEISEEAVTGFDEEVLAEDPSEEVEEFEQPTAVEPDYVEPAGEEVEEPAADASPSPKAAPGFSKLLDSIAGLTGFYGSQPVRVDPVIEESPSAWDEQPAEEEAVLDQEEIAPEPVQVQQPAPEPAEDAAPVALEGTLQNKLTQVRAQAEEARQARLRANSALYEGLGAAYDFALDAEETPEEYLRLVEAQGLKIQLRSPMKPVVKLAFAETCDEPTIKQLEAVLAWAFDQELPRGTLAERIEAAGGIAPILSGQAKAA
ncbi:MAG TPA: hypothetical protein VF750_05385 [Sphingomicrobium sp.]